MRWSIRYQLLVPLLLLLLGILGVSAWSAAAAAGRARQQIETRMRHVAAVLGGAHFPLTPAVLEMTRGLSGAEFLLVRKDGGRATTLAAAPAELPPADAVREEPGEVGLGLRVVVADTPYLSDAVRLRTGPDAGATLYIFYPEALWRDALWEAAFPSLALGVGGGAAALLLAVGVAGRLGRRVRQLERRTRLIAAGDFSPMPLPGRDDELRDLMRSVNEMAGQLARLQEAVQKNERLRLLGQVSGGLAHQLRNGVTGARLAVQLHAADCASAGDAEALDVALRQLARVEGDVKRFLDLGRDDGPRREPCSVPAVLAEAVGLVRPQCRHARIDLRCQPPDEDVTVLGDAGRLGHLFLNLLTNAVEAAGPGGWVGVAVHTTDPAQCIIEITDSGPGPAADVAARLFEPFVTGKREGVGLGLAVARQAAAAHGGSVAWDRDAGHTRFRVELPANFS